VSAGRVEGFAQRDELDVARIEFSSTSKRRLRASPNIRSSAMCGGFSPIMDFSNQVICDSVLPNGQTIGNWINQLSDAINQAGQNTPPIFTPYGPGLNPDIYPDVIADQVFESTKFRSMFAGPGANYKQLGDMGNFAYAAVSANLGVPFFVTELVAGYYSHMNHPPKDWVGPYGMDPSATVNVPLGYNSQCTD
jgi:hypothetical protein